MKYKYLYQTSENRNLEGWISAPNRAEAYAALRKRGILPYRLVGNVPLAWRRPAALALAAFAVAAAAVALAAGLAGRGADGMSPARRQQLPDGSTVVAKGLENGWGTDPAERAFLQDFPPCVGGREENSELTGEKSYNIRKTTQER